jgi:hypothetical protein
LGLSTSSQEWRRRGTFRPFLIRSVAAGPHENRPPNPADPSR